jgi:hypothetical protein
VWLSIVSPRQPPQSIIDLSLGWEVFYQDILATIENMALTMERSPSFFQKATETNIRDFLLVTLNAIYQGAATGETFSIRGKTDIQIIHENKSIFIAELKFWDGPQSLTNATDQLLGYLAWRNTRTAVVLLSKYQDFTSVLNQIEPTLREHSCFKSVEPRRAETVFKFTFRQKHDADRQVFLTVLAFNLLPA